MRLKGKLAVVTAAASGMGKAACELFAREGAAIVAVDINEQGLQALVKSITERGGKAHALRADLSITSECRNVVNKSAELLGGIDIFWNHAGDPAPAGIEGIDMDAYERAMALNVRSCVVTGSEVVPHMRKRGGGSILFTASVSGLVGSMASPIYSAGKFAVVGLTKSMALGLAADSIRVNVLCPGLTETGMLRGFTVRGGGDDATHERNLKNIVATIPMGRLGRPEEMAQAALWIVSDEASYVTCVALPIDGGFTAR
jgi:NAD(P)-dependent dehydrogenase (short-subunit alcohol dehydrogenase family)